MTMKALIIGLTKASSMAKKPNTPFDVQVIMDDLRDTYVKTPRDQTLLDHFDRLLQRDQNGIPIAKPVTFTKNGETRGIVLIDGPGGGKTSLVDHALRVHPAFSAAAPNTMPVIKARVATQITMAVSSALREFTSLPILGLRRMSPMAGRTAASQSYAEGRLWAVRVPRHKRRKVCIRCKCEAAVSRWRQLTFKQPRNRCLCCGA